MIKIVLLPKEYIQQMNFKEKEQLSIEIIKVIFKQCKNMDGKDIRKLFKNVYNLGIYKSIEFPQGTYKILSTGNLKELL